MHRSNYTREEINFNRWTYKRKTLWLPSPVIGCEDPMWYDGIYCYMDRKWRRYSVRANIPMTTDEMCKYWHIYKVEKIIDWPGPYEYHYKILSEREDK